MQKTNCFKIGLSGFLVVIAVALAIPNHAAAHCDTLDGPVVQDARLAIEARDITPVLKWVKPQDEKAVTAAFQKVLADKRKNPEVAEYEFFETLVKIHRAGEGASFAGLKPAGAVEPAVTAADQALASGSVEGLVQMITTDVAAGIRARYERAAMTFKHKDESIAQGREFVAAYVEFTHYVERLHQDAAGKGAPGDAAGHDEHNMGGGHSQH